MDSEEKIVIDVDLKNGEKTIEDFKKEIKGLRSELLNLDEGTEDYEKTVKELTSVQKSLNKELEDAGGGAYAMAENMGNVARASAGAMGAIEAVEGAMHLMGAESEAVEKSIAKMQAIMSITDGFSAIADGAESVAKLTSKVKESEKFQKLYAKATKLFGTSQATANVAIKGGSKALGGFKKALISTGIGAIVVALGVMVARWDDIKEGIVGVTDKLRGFDVLKPIFEQLDKIGGAFKRIISAVKDFFTSDAKKAQNAAEKNAQAISKSYEEMVASNKHQLDLMAAAEEETAEMEIEMKQRELLMLGKLKDAYKKAKDEENLASTTQTYKELADEIEVLNVKLETKKKKELESIPPVEKNTEVVEDNTTVIIENTDANEEANKKLEERTKLINSLTDANKSATEKEAELHAANLALIGDDEKAIELENQRHANAESKIAYEEGSGFDTTEFDEQHLSNKQDLAEGEISEEEFENNELDIEIQQNQARIDSLNTLLENEALIGEERKRAESELTTALGEQADLQIEQDRKVAAEKEKTVNDIVGATMAGLDATANLLNTFADQIEINEKMTTAEKKKAEKKKKGLQIASATISMITGAVQAFSGAFTLGPIAGPIVGAINAASVIAAGIANINKIKSTKVDENGGEAGGGAAGSFSAGPDIAQQALNNAIQDKPQAVQQIEGASTEAKIRDQRVYVLESDITNTQNKVSTVENESTF